MQLQTGGASPRWRAWPKPSCAVPRQKGKSFVYYMKGGEQDLPNEKVGAPDRFMPLSIGSMEYYGIRTGVPSGG
jgi:hypothetical protein